MLQIHEFWFLPLLILKALIKFFYFLFIYQPFAFLNKFQDLKYQFHTIIAFIYSLHFHHGFHHLIYDSVKSFYFLINNFKIIKKEFFYNFT